MKKVWAFCGIAVLVLAGCSNRSGIPVGPEVTTTSDAEEEMTTDDGGLFRKEQDDLEKIAAYYQDLYESVAQNKIRDNMGLQKKMVERIAQYGYPVVDANNKINMIGSEQVVEFCDAVQKSETADLVILRLTDIGGLNRCDFHTKDGQVEVVRTSLTWSDEGEPVIDFVENYIACTWNYTDNGYLIFERQLPEGFDGDTGHNAIRVKPLSDKLRKLNEAYIASVGYSGNNLFLTNWEQGKYGDLCFQDLYLYFQALEGNTINIGTKKKITAKAEKFEPVFMKYLNVDPLTLQKSVKFDEGKETYSWTRKDAEASAMSFPYPEVVASKDKGNGRIQLTVHAVWADQNTDQAFVHVVTIQKGEDGSFQYLSNKIKKSDKNKLPEYQKSS